MARRVRRRSTPASRRCCRSPRSPADPHLAARGTWVDVDGVVQPAPAPRFDRTPAELDRPPAPAGHHTDEVLAEAGFTADEIAELRPTAPSPDPPPRPDADRPTRRRLATDRGPTHDHPRTAVITGSASGIGAAIRAAARGRRPARHRHRPGRARRSTPTCRPPEGGPRRSPPCSTLTDGRIDALVPGAGLGPQVADRAADRVGQLLRRHGGARRAVPGAAGRGRARPRC